MSQDQRTIFKNKPKVPTYEEESGTDFERVIFFSDAVMAIAITLLILEIKIPELDPSLVAQDLPAAIWGILPQLLIYAFSFLVIAHYWVAHHRMFRYIKRYDVGLIWLNVLFLLCVAFLPVPSAIASRYPNQPSAVAFGSLCLAVTSLMATFLWIYAIYRRLIDEDLSPRLVRRIQIRGWFAVGMFGLAAGTAFVNISLAKVLLFAFFVLSTILGSMYYPLLARVYLQLKRKDR